MDQLRLGVQSKEAESIALPTVVILMLAKSWFTESTFSVITVQQFQYDFLPYSFCYV